MEFLFKSNGKINAAKLNQSYFEKYHIEELSNILKYVETNSLVHLNFSQKVYHYVHNLKSIPTCKQCGVHVRYKSYTEGYGEYCSRACIAKSIDIKNKTRDTFIKKYGVTNPNKTKEVRDKIKSTNLKKYGVEYGLSSTTVRKKIKRTNNKKYGGNSPTCNPEIAAKQRASLIEKYGVDSPIKNEKIRDRIKKTNNEKYGADNVFSSDLIQQKIKNKLVEKYGVDNPNKSVEIREKTRNTNIDRYGVPNPSMSPIISDKIKNTHLRKSDIDILKKYGLKVIRRTDHGNIVMICETCGKEYETTSSMLYLRNKRGITQCTLCNDPTINKTSFQEQELFQFINEVSTFEVQQNVRSVIGVELDLYIPELKLAIEYDGLYWHSELFKDKFYHLDKKQKCEKLGITLIHIFEDEWVYNKEIVKSRILNLIGISKLKINARSCEICEIRSNEAKPFMVENHIQGHINSKISIALKMNGNIVSVMTFGSLRKITGHNNAEGVYEMLRFCNLKNTVVRGAAGKMLSYFIRKYSPHKIITYADYRWSNGQLYEKLGFKNTGLSSPNYWYILHQTRKHRFSYRKDTLVKQGFDRNKTEFEIMLDRKIYKIWDCGNLKFEYDCLKN